MQMEWFRRQPSIGLGYAKKEVVHVVRAIGNLNEFILFSHSGHSLNSEYYFLAKLVILIQ